MTLYLFFEQYRGTGNLRIDNEIAKLDALMKKDDVHGIVENCDRLISVFERTRNYPFLAGTSGVAGWANYRLGLQEKDWQQKITYFQQARRHLEICLMVYPRSIKSFPAGILTEVNRFLEDAARKDMEKGVPEPYFSIFGLYHLESEAVEMYIVQERLKSVRDPVEKSLVLLKCGRLYLDLGISFMGKIKISPAGMACLCWNEILRLQERGGGIYPDILIAAIKGLLYHDNFLAFRRPEELCQLGTELCSSREEKKKIKEAFYYAIGNIKMHEDKFLGITI